MNPQSSTCRRFAVLPPARPVCFAILQRPSFWTLPSSRSSLPSRPSFWTKSRISVVVFCRALPLRRASARALPGRRRLAVSLVDGVIRQTRPRLCALGHTRASRLLPLTFKVVILALILQGSHSAATLQSCHSERSEESPYLPFAAPPMRVPRSHQLRPFGGSCWTGWGVEEYGP